MADKIAGIQTNLPENTWSDIKQWLENGGNIETTLYKGQKKQQQPTNKNPQQFQPCDEANLTNYKRNILIAMT